MAEASNISWKAGALEVVLTVGVDGIVRLAGIHHIGQPNTPRDPSALFEDASLPLTDIRLAGEGTDDTKSSKTLICGLVTERLKYQSHHETSDFKQQTLEVISRDDVSGLTVTTTFIVYPDTPALRFFATVHNAGAKNVVLCQVNSLVVGGLAHGSRKWWHDYVAASATNTWFREAQWHDHDLPSLGLDSIGVIELNQGHVGSHAAYSVVNRGNFSSGGMLPMGMLRRRDNKETWLWQIENNGSWRWEMGDFKEDIYVALGGPNAFNHSWKECLRPGESFTTVPCALVHVQDGIDAAFAAMTEYRRHIRRKHKDNETLPIIFNDYMNCLMGDPTEEKVKALIQPELYCGAEYFVIDAGWYAEELGGDWWDSVGEWLPAKSRFPSGFRTLISHIASTGCVPGIWLEPEVVGVRSPIANQLPEEAFFQENGKRVVEKKRYQLDYRHPAVIERMDKVVDSLVNDYGIGYFKLDYNVDVANGTDHNAFSPGCGALGHNRAYLRWIKRIFDRFPDLVIETCSSGGQRLDYAMLAEHPIQSTSDQQDPVRSACVSATIATAIAPEQSASWAYPQPDWSDEINALTVVNTLLGRVHLSGRIDLLSESQLNLVREGMDVYKQIRNTIKDSVPFWPLNLNHWHDDWLAFGLKAKSCLYVAVWRRGGSLSCTLPLGLVDGTSNSKVELLYPANFEAEAVVESGALKVTLPQEVCARLFRINGI